MINRRFEDIAKPDIDALLDNQVSEGRTLDYKLKLPENADADKKEFLADVSSFANAGGGDIIYGISERKEDGKNTGIPEAVVGLPGLNADAETLRLEGTLRNGLDPRIPGVQVKAIEGFPDGPVFVLRIPRSWAAPHMVTFKDTSRFFSRTSAGKYQLDVREIRSAFALSEGLAEQAERFRNERLSRIVADETPVPLIPGGKAVVHLLPLNTLQSHGTVNLSGLDDAKRVFFSVPYSDFNLDQRFNFDGFLQWEVARHRNYSAAYVQFFRNGSVEMVVALCEYENSISDSYIESTLNAVKRFFNIFQDDFGIEPPIVALLSFVDVKGYGLITPGNNSFRGNKAPIDRDVLMLPDVLLETYNADLPKVLRPAFDALWQACGYADSADAV